MSKVFLITSGLLMAGCYHNKPILNAPADFGFVIKNHVNTTDSFEGNYTRKRIRINRSNANNTSGIGDTSVAFHLDRLQLDSLYSQFEKISFFSLPEKVVDVCPGMVPGPGTTTIMFRSNGQTKQVKFVICWNSEREDKKTIQVEEFLNMLTTMLYRQKQIAELPESHLNVI